MWPAVVYLHKQAVPLLLSAKCLEMSSQNCFVKGLHVGLISAAEDVIAVLKSKL